MYSTLITAVALFAAPAFAAFAINSPDLKQCETSRISWEKTEGPYNLIVVDAADPCGEPLIEVGDFENSSIQWKAVLPAGTIVQLSVADKNDDEAWSANITIAASNDASCLPGAPAAQGTTGNTAETPKTGSTTGTTTGTTTDTTGDDGSDIAPVGAANAGTNALLGGKNAAVAHSVSTPFMALSAIAAIAAIAL